MNNKVNPNPISYQDNTQNEIIIDEELPFLITPEIDSKIVIGQHEVQLDDISTNN